VLWYTVTDEAVTIAMLWHTSQDRQGE
jgi:hypothetical protein